MEKLNVKTLSCPNCGGPLKVENEHAPIVCVFCDSTVVPVAEEPKKPQKVQNEGGFTGTVRVEGIKTSASALAYVEEYFEDYDWEVFAYDRALSIDHVDRLAASLKSSAADDKNTWFVCFQAVYVPFVKKLESCSRILELVILAYEKEDMDGYSKFDAYKRIANKLNSCRGKIAQNLEKLVAKAARYGASAEEARELMTKVEQLQAMEPLPVYRKVEEIPQVKELILQKNTRILQQLAEQGIDGARAYKGAQQLVNEGKYVQALGLLRKLMGYEDTEKMISKINKYFLMGDVLELQGKRYFFKQRKEKDSYGYEIDKYVYDLYPTNGRVVENKPIIENIGNILTNYGDVLYYMNEKDRLCRYHLGLGQSTCLGETRFSRKNILVQGDRVLLTSVRNQSVETESAGTVSDCQVVELNIASGEQKTILGDVQVVKIDNGRLVYNIREMIGDEWCYCTRVLDLDTGVSTQLAVSVAYIAGFAGNKVVYTVDTPNGNNKNLYVKILGGTEPAKLLETNIYSFCDMIDESLFFYVGNSRDMNLIKMNLDGTGRMQWPRRISKILYEQGGWLYFIRKEGHNGVLCKARMNGSQFTIIADDIDEHVCYQNGYMYYISNDADLVKVRMDGSNRQELCANVAKVLSVKEDKIIFQSADDRLPTDGFNGQYSSRTVGSIYAVEFDGSGKRKLAYDVKNAQDFDENTVYYVMTNRMQKEKPDEQPLDVLYSLDAETYRAMPLLELKVPEEKKEEEKMSAFAKAMIVMCVGFFFGFIGLVAEAGFLAFIGIATGIIALLVGLYKKYGKALS